MKSLFAHWAEVVERLRAAPGFFIALDFDGVLSPIAARPGAAHFPARNRELLQTLASHDGVRVAIVSGRALDDIRRHVGLEELIYAGNHGAEIALDGHAEKHIELELYREALLQARADLMELAAQFAGAHIEDKGFGVGLHYREVAHPKLPELHGRFNEWVKTLPAKLKIAPAKMMYEVRPNVDWNKGNAVLRIWQSIAPEALPICLGDDHTDEDGFVALRGKGLNIFVGRPEATNAEFLLASTEEVTHFLQRLLTEAERRASKRAHQRRSAG